MKTLIRSMKSVALAAVTMAFGMSAHAENFKMCTDCITFSSERPFTVQVNAVGNSAPAVNLEYSTDLLEWIPFDQTASSASPLGAVYRIHLRGTNNTHFASDSSNRRSFSLESDAEVGIACSGNIETLLDYRKVAAGVHPPMDGSGFAWLFLDCRSLTETPALPATDLTPGCYQGMFSGCTSVMQAPALPAENLAAGCYQDMFVGCMSLTTAPELSAESLTENCYKGMFNGCKQLTAAPKLPATNLATGCYQDMFVGCSSLTAAPALPATNLTSCCYRCMFSACRSLTAAPSLPASTLAGNCYQDMFNGCTSLKTAPSLPASTLADSCYQSMFSGCTSLTVAPQLPAQTMTGFCYQGMFNGCTSLTAAPQLPARMLSVFCYQSMFSGCKSLKRPPELSAPLTMPGCYMSMFSGCTSLTTLPELPSTYPTAYCYYHMFEGCSSLKVNSSSPGASWGLPGFATLEQGWNEGMFSGTGGDFTGDPEPGTTYYIASAGTTVSVSAPSTVTCQVTANGVPVSVPCTVDYTTSVCVTYTAKSGYVFPDGSSSFTTNFTPNAASVTVPFPPGRHPVPTGIGITNIHVNAFVPYSESFTGTSVGNVSMWLAMTEDGLAKKIYLEQHYRGVDEITNCVPDAFFPTNTIVAYVWRGQGAALTNAYNQLTADVAKKIIDPEVVNLLTNFSPLVKSVTRGIGSATIPYIDVDGNQQFGKAVVLGCESGDWTAYEILVNELKRIGDGYEYFPKPGTRRYVVTNSTATILGSREPSVTGGPSGYTYISSSRGVEDAVHAAGGEYVTTGRKPFYDARRQAVVGSDAELRKIDPTYPRDFKTEGFERFGYAVVTSKYLPALAKTLEDIGINPAIAGTNMTFHYLATLCSEECKPENSRMRIDLQGSEAALRLIGGSLRFTNLLLVNAGIVDEDFMTFDEDWKFDKETLAKISALTAAAREQLGLNGVDYWFDDLGDRAATTAVIGYTPGKKFEQLFCAGKAGRAEENPCENSLPSNTVAGFVFQPSAAAWTELNERLFTLLGKKSEALDQLFAAFKSHSNSFGKSASIGVILGSGVKNYGSNDALSSALGFVSSVKIEDENLWYSIRILLEQFGCTTRVGEIFPAVTVCEFPDSTLSVAYDREYKIVELATRREFGHAASVARRNREARLIRSDNDVFNDRMGIDVEAGEEMPDHNTLFYFAPEYDTVLREALKEYLDSVGLGALAILDRRSDLSDTWVCGYGTTKTVVAGTFEAYSHVSKNIWDKGHRLFEAMSLTLGQVAAAAYPYDASKARVFIAGDTTLHVSRADNWDDVNHCLYPYDGENIRIRFQTLDLDRQPYDLVVSGRLDADGRFSFGKGEVYCRGYLTSEGVFGEFNNLATGYFIGRETSEIEPELSILPSAEEVAEQVKKVKDAIGVESVTVGAAKSDDRTGPFGEDTVVRETTIVPTPGGGLDRLIAKKPYAGKTTPACYMPSNTLFGTTFGFADGALTNAIAAIRYVQPELVEYFEKLFGGLGFDQEILASVMDGLALGIAKEENGLEPYFVVRLNRGQKHHWVDLTNRLYHATGVTVTDFQTSHSPDTWEAIAFTVEDPLTGRTIERSYTRVFESEDRDPFFIVTRSTELMSGIMARVRRAGVFGVDRLLDNATFRACEIPRESETRGFAYLAPIEDKYWSFDLISVTEDGELVIKRRTSAAVAPYEATVARFAVNFFEALRGEPSKITFENDPEADKVAEAATSNVVAQLRHMRTRLGVTGLDFYDDDPDEDGRYGNSELAIGTKGDGCEFLRRFAANAPSESALVEEYVPATACALATVNGEPGLLANDIGNSLKVLADLIGEKCPVSATITNFLASDEWRIAAESFRLTGTHRAVAVLQDLEHPFVKDIGDGSYAGISAEYSVFTVFGPMESSLPFLLFKQAFGERAHWKAFTTNGIEYLVHDGQFEDRDLSQFIRPTFAFNAADNVMVFATRLDAAKAAMAAGRDGENRLIDSETFADVTGFDSGEPMPDHNTLYYFAPQNDDILGCTLRRILSPYLPDGYAMLLDRPSLKGYWGAAHGVRDGDVFRLYTHAGAKVHTAFLAAGQALLKTIAEGIRISQPYDWTEPKVFRSADTVRLVEPTAEKGVYIISAYSVSGDFLKSFIDRADSDNNDRFCDYEYAVFMSRRGIFLSTNNGGISSYRAEYDSFHLMILDEETDPADFTGGVAMDFDAREQTFPAGEKVDQRLRIYPADAKVTKVTGLPRGLSLKKAKDGYFLSGTPTKVGEDCYVMLTAACAGRQTTSHNFHFMVSNYASDYATLEAGYGLTAGVDDTLMLTNVIGWTASGVPSGMKFDKTTGALSGTPAKPGEYVVSFTKRIGGTTEKVSTVITVDQGDGIQIATAFSDKTSELAADGETREIYAGVKIDWPVEVKGLDDVVTTLTAKGLPNGLKLVKTMDKLTGEVSYSIQGIATKASSVDRKTGEVKPSTVVLSGTNKYKWSGEEAFDLVVKALPDWAIGTFNGYNGNVQGIVDGSVKVTVSSVGRCSISLSGVSPVTDRALTESFARNGFDSYDPLNKCFSFVIEDAKWKEGDTFRFSGAVGLDKNLSEIGLEIGRFIAYSDMGAYLAIQAASNYDWGKWTFPTGRNQLTLELTDSINPGLEGLTLKFAKGGKVTVAGKVTDPETGRKVSVSASPALVSETDGVFGDGILCASVGFVVKTKTPFYAYVPVWLAVGEGATIVEVCESDPTKDK